MLGLYQHGHVHAQVYGHVHGHAYTHVYTHVYIRMCVHKCTQAGVSRGGFDAGTKLWPMIEYDGRIINVLAHYYDMLGPFGQACLRGWNRAVTTKSSSLVVTY